MKIFYYFIYLLDEQNLKGNNKEEIIEKIDDLEAQLNKCLDGLLEKG
jgi:hypothetical protein